MTEGNIFFVFLHLDRTPSFLRIFPFCRTTPETGELPFFSRFFGEWVFGLSFFFPFHAQGDCSIPSAIPSSAE